MIAFFLTMPIGRITPMRAMIVNGMPNMMSAAIAPLAGRRQRGQNRDRMDKAFAKDLSATQ
jgi:hypothetical protein